MRVATVGGGRAARRGLCAQSSRRADAPPKNNMVLYSVVGRLMWSLRLDSPRLLVAGDVVPVMRGGARRSGFVRKSWVVKKHRTAFQSGKNVIQKLEKVP